MYIKTYIYNHDYYCNSIYIIEFTHDLYTFLNKIAETLVNRSSLLLFEAAQPANHNQRLSLYRFRAILKSTGRSLAVLFTLPSSISTVSDTSCLLP